MDAKSHKDNMEKFFQEKWDDQKMSQELGVPDLDDMWNDIQNQSQPEKKRWPIFWWLLPLVILPTALFFVLSNNDVIELADEIGVVQTLDKNQMLAEADLLQSEAQVEPMSAERIVEDEKVNPQLPIDNKDQRSYLSLAEMSSTDENSESKSIIVSTIPGNNSEFVSKEDQIESGNLSLDSELLKDGMVTMSPSNDLMSREIRPLKGLSPTSLSYESEMVDIGPLSKAKSESLSFDSKQYSLTFTLSQGYHFYTGRSGSQNINGVDVSLEDGSYWRAGLELGMTYRPGRRIKAGLSGKRHAFKSHYELMVNYSGNSEIQDGEGNWHSGYNHSLPTLFGDSPMNHVLIRGENDNLQEGEVIPFALYLDHEVEELALTLTHEWHIPFRKVNLTLGATGQLGYWFAASKIASVNLYSHHDKVWHNHTTFQVDDYQIDQPFNVGLGAEIGLQYQISYRHAIGMRAGLSQTVLGPRLYGDVIWAPTLLDGGLTYTINF